MILSINSDIISYIFIIWILHNCFWCFVVHLTSDAPSSIINAFLIDASDGNPISWSFGFLHKILFYLRIYCVTRRATDNHSLKIRLIIRDNVFFSIIPSNMSNPALFGEKCDVCMALITKIIRRLLPFRRHNGYRISFAKFFFVVSHAYGYSKSSTVRENY